jgi:hypothetical protein
MSAIELKLNFHELIDKIQDVQMLRSLYDCVADFTVETNDYIYLSDDQKERIKASIAQVHSGQTISNDIIKEKVKVWLSK